MSLVSRVLEISPYAEVIVRRIYWRSQWLIDRANKAGVTKPRASRQTSAESWQKIEEFLKPLGVCEGALIVVHSSGTALKPTGYPPARINDKLLDLIGRSGTLAMPAIPRYEGEPQGIERMRADVSHLELVYDVQKSVPWTGALPLKLMRHPAAVRSRHPLNSMVAVGPLARQMMENNLSGERPLPCGIQSSWKFCADHNAVIIALGVDMAHSITMIHVAEDCYEQEWPIRGWYRDRKFQVVDHGEMTRVVVRERHPKWAAHYAERTLSKDLRRAGLMARASIDGISVEVIGAGELLRFLGARRSSAYPYFMIPADMKKAR